MRDYFGIIIKSSLMDSNGSNFCFSLSTNFVLEEIQLHMRLTLGYTICCYTGQRSMKASMMAAKFMEAINDFIVNVDPKHLHLIRVVIYEAKMVDEFCDGLAAKSFGNV